MNLSWAISTTFLFLLPHATVCQTRTLVVTGTVRSAKTEEPISAAVVTLNTATVVSDSIGAFMFPSAEYGKNVLWVKRLGFAELEFQLTIEQPDTAVEFDITLTPLPVRLGDLEVVGPEAHPYLASQGFYERRKLGFGAFLTRDEFEKWTPTQTTDVLRRVRGFRVIPNPRYGLRPTPRQPPDTRRWLVRSTRLGARIGRGGCPPLYFVDGLLLGDTDAISIDQALSVGFIEAIEAYSGMSQVPAKFNVTGSRCGVILFWTR